MRQRFNEELQQYLWSKYPFEFKFSPSKEHTFWTLYKQKEDFRPEVDKSLSHLATLSNYPFFWYNLGCSIDDAFKYSTTKGYKVCQWCEKIYHLDTRYKSCCSEECYKQNRLRGNARLSESKLKYNSRDPEQYAIRHGISVEEAAVIVDDFVNGGSVRRKEYWIKRGYTEEEAILKVSEVQSRCSARCIVYWEERGYSPEEAKIKVSEIQREACMHYHENASKEVHQQNSSWCVEFWVKRGHTISESRRIISTRARAYSKMQLLKYTEQERREYNPMCLDYWIKKHGRKLAKIKYAEYKTTVSNLTFRSKVADQFFSELSSYFKTDTQLYSEKELCLLLPNGNYIKPDYINVERNICVEFFGDYWHANPKKYKATDIISYPNKTKRLAKDIWTADAIRIDNLTRMGYNVLIVWERDYYKNSKELIEKTVQEIKNENI